MLAKDSKSQLVAAEDLLSMLEYLIDSIPQEGHALLNPPFAGMKVTLRKARELIRESMTQAGAQTEQYAENRNARRNTTLADRVQPAPATNARARDLLNNPSEARKAPRIQEPTSPVAANDMV